MSSPSGSGEKAVGSGRLDTRQLESLVGDFNNGFFSSFHSRSEKIPVFLCYPTAIEKKSVVSVVAYLADEALIYKRYICLEGRRWCQA